MGKFVMLVMGPAGVGKSFFCKSIQDHGRSVKRSIHIGNLDPAADNCEYDASFDIKDLVTVEDVMEEHGFGPNGGLVFCMEHLVSNLDWLKDQLDEFGEDECVFLDCPGQVELYSHLPVMHTIARSLDSWGYRSVGIYLLDALFVLEPSKFISGCMLSLSCMLQLELPHINVITKCDIADKEKVSMILDSEGADRIIAFDGSSNNKLKKLTKAIGSVIDDYMMVSFVMLDVTDEDSIEEVLYRIDHCAQYGEDVEPKEPKYAEGEDTLDLNPDNYGSFEDL